MARISGVAVCLPLLIVGCGKPPTSNPAQDAADPTDGSMSDGNSTDGQPMDGRPASPPNDGRLIDALVTDGRRGCPTDSPSLAGPVGVPEMPGLGAHAMIYCKYMSDLPDLIATAQMDVQPSGSTIVVGVGRGDNTKFVLPTDAYGNTPYLQLGEMRPYNHPWTGSGTALYAFTSAAGGPGFQVTTAVRSDPASDEITMAAVEVVGGTRVVAYEWNVLDKAPLTSRSVTTTGPATLIAFWWGSGFPGESQTATPNNDFVLIESNAFETDSFIQSAVAVKHVTADGTYNVTWTATPEQGAQMWLVAVQ